jgi:hypothetical protein
MVFRAKRRCAGLAAGCCLTWSLLAAAADPASGEVEAGRAPAPARKGEFWVHTGYVDDWRGPAGADPAFALGIEKVPFVSLDQRWRLGWYFGGLWGHWGDREHSSAGFDVSLRFRASAYMTDFWDIYVLTKVGIIGAFDGRFGLRPGLGAGFRVLRGAALEITIDDVIALGDRFAGGARVLPGMTAALGFDLCILGTWCLGPKPPNATTMPSRVP